MAKQVQLLTIMNVKIEQTERIEMEELSKIKTSSSIQILSTSSQDSLIVENNKAKSISKCVEMSISSNKKNNSSIECLTELIEDPLIDESDRIKFISKRIYMNYEKRNWINVIEDINMYQQITHSNKYQLLKIKSELHQTFHKSRIALMELVNDNDSDDNDEHEHFFLTISPKNIDDFMNGRFTSKPNKKLKK